MFSRLRGVMRKLQERLLYAELTRESLEEVCDELLLELVESDVAYEAAEAILNELVERLVGVRAPRGEGRRGLVREKLREVLTEILTPERISLAEVVRSRRDGGRPCVLLFLGPNGHGKTTTVAKIAARLRAETPDIPITFAAADTFRAAAIEQLGVWAERIGADIIKHRIGADPAAVVFDAIDHAVKTGGVLLIDTAGRLHTKHNLMEELKKIERTVQKKLGRPSDERLLVLDATTGQNGISQARLFHDAIDLSGIVLTKLDGTAKGGVVLAIWEELKLPILYIGVGEQPEDLHEFSAEQFVEALFSG